MKERHLIVLLVLIAFVWRIIALLNSHVVFFSDDAIYASLARFFYNGDLSHAFHPTWPPLFPFASSVVYFFVRNWERSLQIVSVISGSILVVPLYFLFRSRLTKLGAFVSSLSISFLTFYLWASLYPISDMLSSLLSITGVVLFFLGIEKKGYKYFIWSFVFFGLTFLTRSEGTMFFGLSLVFLTGYLFVQVIKRKEKVKKFLIIPLSILVFLFVSSPYILAERYQLGHFTLSQKFSAQIKQGHSFQLKKGTTWSQEVVSISNPNYKSEYLTGGTLYMLENEDWFVWWFRQKFGKWKNTFYEPLPKVIVVLFLIGVISLLRKKNFFSFGYLLFITVVGLLLVIFNTPSIEIRYFLWGIPFILFIIVNGVVEVCSLLKIKRFIPIGIVLLIFSLPYIKLNQIFNPALAGGDETRTMAWEETRQAGEWIKKNSGISNPKIMMRHEGVEFYSEGTTIYMPEVSLSEVISYAKEKNVKYLVAWDRELISDKELQPLMKEDIVPGLKRVYQTEETSPKIIVYEVE